MVVALTRCSGPGTQDDYRNDTGRSLTALPRWCSKKDSERALHPLDVAALLPAVRLHQRLQLALRAQRARAAECVAKA